MTSSVLDPTYEVVNSTDFDPSALDTVPADSQTAFEYACEVCGVELFYGGRGRKPHFCDEHKKNAPKGTRSPQTSKRSGNWQQPLEDALMAQLAMVGVTVYAFDQFDGQAVLNGSPALAKSLVGVAETNPRVKDALLKMVTAGAWAQVASAVAAIALPILSHHKLLPFQIPQAV